MSSEEGWNWKEVICAIALFAAAGVCEIGGGWMVWRWRRHNASWLFLMFGSIALVLYGIIPTLQAQTFGRTYAAYGGFFIALSLLWAYLFESSQPDRWDIVGALIATAGACCIMFAPRPPS